MLDIVFATREPEEFDLADLKPLIAYGASPRATIYLITTAKAYAFLHGCGYVTPEDIKQVVMDVLRHHIIVTYEAEAEELTSEDVVWTSDLGEHDGAFEVAAGQVDVLSGPGENYLLDRLPDQRRGAQVLGQEQVTLQTSIERL